MGKNYITTIAYSIKYTNPPENLFLSNNPPKKFNLEVEAHGFTLLRHKLSFSVSPVVLNLTTIKNNAEPGNNMLSVQTSSLMRSISSQISNEISIIEIEPNLITLVYDSLEMKKVPLIADLKLNFKPQFFLKAGLILTPDSVLLSGPSSVIDTILSLKTRFQNFDELDSPISKMMSVVHPGKTKIEPEKVRLEIPVERFTEKKMDIPLTVKNKPKEGKIKIFPSEVVISFLVGLSDYEKITPTDFQIYAVYDSLQNSENLEVIVGDKPDYIQQLRISPPNVEYLIETE